MDPRNEHDWFRAHMIPFDAALLGEEEEDRFRGHLSDCADCRRVWDQFSKADEEAEGIGEHIPSGILAAWDHAAPALRGLERAMVERHLERCEQCRQDLRALGFDPQLRLPAANIGLRRKEPRSGWPRPWTTWLLGGWAVAATAFLLAMVLRPSAPERLGETRGLVLPWVAPETVRGEQVPAKVGILPDQMRLVLAVPIPMDAQLDADALIEVRAPDNQSMVIVPVSKAEMERRRVMLVLETPAPLRPGTYRIIFRQGDPARPLVEPVEMSFELYTKQHR